MWPGMYLRIGWLSGWALVALLLGTMAVATFALARPASAASSAAASSAAVPAPTLIWLEPDPLATGTTRYVRGLTKNGTEVSVTVGGRVLGGVTVRRGPAGTASFAAAIPAELEVGVHTVTAAARLRGGAWSGPSQPLRIVVEGEATVDGYLSFTPHLAWHLRAVA